MTTTTKKLFAAADAESSVPDPTHAAVLSAYTTRSLVFPWVARHGRAAVWVNPYNWVGCRAADLIDLLAGDKQVKAPLTTILGAVTVQSDRFVKIGLDPMEWLEKGRA